MTALDRDRQEALDRFYAILDDVADRSGGPRELSGCHPDMGWPECGVYFFFEAGENRTCGGPRVVRVGTHRLTRTSRSTLWQRLAQHRGRATGGNHRGSIFRLHVGTALIARDGWSEAARSWGRADVTDQDRRSEYGLERAVSAYIGSMPFLHVAVASRELRVEIEAGAIALLSNADRVPLDTASDGWLGHHADREAVRRSHLWNVRHVDDPWTAGWLDDFEASVVGREAVVAARPHEVAAEQASGRWSTGRPVLRGARPRGARAPSREQSFDPSLWPLIEKHIGVGEVIRTLGRGQPNTVVECTTAGLVIATERSIARGSAGEEVPAWMFNVAWRALQDDGLLTAQHLLNELQVKRSSAVLAVLARLPGVEAARGPLRVFLQG